MAWYNITCRSGGSNMNAGATDGVGECAAATVLTNTNGGWDNTTNVFTCSGTPDLSGLVVGHRVSVAADATTDPSTGVVTGTISAFDNTAKTVTVTNKATFGPAVGTAASGITLRVGGALQGPNAASSYPLNHTGIMQGPPSTNPLRINLKNDATYSVTAAISCSQTSTRVQGYTSTFGDGGKFVLDGGTSGASYTLLTMSGANSELYDAEIRNNGATGSAAGLSVTGALCDLFRVTVHDVRGVGILQVTNRITASECLTYACNQSNALTTGGMALSTSNVPCMFFRCVSRDNVGSNSRGFTANVSNFLLFRDCVFESNGQIGVSWGNTVYTLILTGCDFYANGSDGLAFSGASGIKPVFLTDCNFVANGGYGVNGTGAGTAMGLLQNCGFGSGTAANTSGATNALGDTRVAGSITYAANATPWVDPAATDFSPNASVAARGTGITAGSTSSRPDRAAAQAEAGSIAGAGSTGVVSSGF